MDALLHSITITNALPCLADPVLIRVWADFSDDISGIMPYLNAVVPGIIYNPNGLSVTIKRGGRLITAYAGQIAIGKLADINDAHRTLEWFKDLVNDTFAKKDKITPVYERRKTLSAVDIYKLLPGENCGKCGVPTCLAVITQILSGDFNIMKCGPLFGAEFRDRRKELLRILQAAGYEVPGEFL
ncbi:hypothetical protein COY52_11795 [Candidatus Desantisbacteria bacterium CG_4_10_14_0_8_um_filter_48_22]|uniref:4Fe-4S domain-containing protein n=1 Tax=Candidatus Desantisbacteria bacterium CG_4_10_14_0_8_um_filter_48_22 TaxID=1974543 RepID=A0A2M7S4Z9_9BACT|nr:MAG: hypothetical protein AUJ67_01485 [Candidatus Desantisbacteria bacterium CG1_02_49_89]PIV57320.1 MAG: hypothetical protein COS16_00955 [Candidatus Desantisbacteria bacterium CG02_land_8_20_14_3_00_49_13]PIZ14631.1 MAG: hypothetical protein COY52_11795 [Candidatus Desantisbacteria bacterium CG_4_10_14_0_8_um_filter_48_22]